MYIQVRLLKGYPQPLLYEVPSHLQNNQDLISSIVRVPIQKRIEQALVLNVFTYKPKTSFEIRPIIAIEQLPPDPHYQPFIKIIAQYYQTDELHYLRRIYQFITQKPLSAQETTDQAQALAHITLTCPQQAIVDYVGDKIDKQTFAPTLIHGVTGSGKTEVYKKLIERTWHQHKTTILLLPEVTLALQFERLLKEQLPSSIMLRSFHSASSTKDKRTIWQRLRDQEPSVIIGVHVPILLPLPKLGLIIIDEEHEVGYQEKKHPKTNTKEAALMRAKLHNIPIVLGSATPSISSLYNVKHRGWQFFQLKKRFAGNFPEIKIVSLADKKQRKNFWISQELQNEIKERLNKHEQVILFLNRRGYSFFVQCKQCSFIFECSNCSVSLTLHEQLQLMCHYCAFMREMPSHCPSCKADEKTFLKKGIGTQQLVTVVHNLFPQARIARADLDTSTKKKQWKQTIEQFQNGELDILVGTQTITKGYDFANVTLVGIIWADLNLHFPRYNATETTLQQLIQVAGRAGRKTEHSLVVVQTMAQHHVFNFLQEMTYLQFYKQELSIRQEVGYPPCTRLVELECKHVDEQTVINEIASLAKHLLRTIENKKLPVHLLGPAKPPISKIKNAHTRIIFLKSKHMHALYTLFQSIDKKAYNSIIFFTPNPL